MKALILTFFLLCQIPAITEAQWTRTNGPYGGGGFELFTRDTSMFLSGSILGKLAKFDGKEERWRESDSGSLRSSTANVIAFASIGKYLLVGTEGGGVFRSSDDGTSWETSSNGLLDSVIWCFATQDSFVFAGTDNQGIFRSRDSGRTWIHVSSPWYKVQTLLAAGADLYATPEWSWISRSTDAGQTWTEADNGLHGSSTSVLTSLDGKLFDGTDSGFYTSIDRGDHWNLCNTGIPSGYWPGLTEESSMTSLGKLLVVSTNAGIYVSNDSGINWQVSDSGLSNTLIISIARYGTSIFVSTYNGLFESDDSGRRWFEVDSGISFPVQTNVLLKDGRNVFVGTSGGVYLTTDDGANWKALSVGLTDLNIEALAQVQSAGHPILFAGTIWGPFRSTDYGANWIHVDSGFPNYPSDYPEVYSFAVIDTTIFATAGSGDLVRSSNYGMSWQILPTTPTSLYQTLGAEGNKLFAGGIWNLEDAGFLSTDGGRYWTFPSVVSHNDWRPNAVMIDTDAVGNLFLYDAGYYGVFRSLDSGVTWIPYNAGLGINSRFTYDFLSKDTEIVTAAYYGVYISSFHDTKWSPFNTGLADSNFHSVVASDQFLFAGGQNGVWRRPLSEMIPSSVVSDPPIISSNIKSYPNPFSQSTTIRITSPASGEAEVTIVNLLGYEVARLFSGTLAQGPHSFTWDASGVAPGMYECVVRMNGTVERVSIMLLP